MARRRIFDEAILTQLREIPASEALGWLAIRMKADRSYVPVKTDRSQRWHALTTRGEFELVTTGCRWYDTRRRCGGGGAIDLAMHVLSLSFVDAVKQLTRERKEHRSDYS